ncbi:MAG: cytochrome c biogenesis protein [Cyanobacteria bacterium KgW148]|nr:cytochrome c biogenesis protein [Cyanobacteria bacterium KgW148]
MQSLWRREVVPLLGNLKFAIVLLLLIAVFSVTGTVIEQGQTEDFYQTNYPLRPALFGFLTYRVILGAGLDRVYSTWWFLTLLILFGASLVTCTIYRQIPLLRVARRWFFVSKPQSITKLPYAVTLSPSLFEVLIEGLQRQGYRVSQTDRQFYGCKGLVGRIGPIVVHGGMVVILLGAVVGALGGFIAQEMIPEGETFTISNVTQVGLLGRRLIPQDWAVKVNRFWIDYSEKGKISQFYSDLSVVDRQGKELDRETIYVNKPLRFQGVTLYQASWDIKKIQFRFNQSPLLELPLSPLEGESSGQRVWGTWIPTKPDLSEGISLVVPDLQGTVLIFAPDGSLLHTTRVGSRVEVNGVNLQLVSLVGATGLQIKADPGIPIVYAGFALLMAGVMMSYISYSQVWALKVGDTLYFGGKTNRAQVAFYEELNTLLASLGKMKDQPVGQIET